VRGREVAFHLCKAPTLSPPCRQTAVSGRSSITLHDCTNLEASRLSPGKEDFFSFPSITPRALRLYKRLIVSPKALKPEMILNDARFKIIAAVLRKVQVFWMLRQADR